MGFWPSATSRWLDIGQALLCVFKEQDAVDVLKHIKNDHVWYPAILTVQVLSIMDLLRGLKNTFFLGIAAVNLEPSKWPYPAHLVSQSQRRIWFFLRARGPSPVIMLFISSFRLPLLICVDKSCYNSLWWRLAQHLPVDYLWNQLSSHVRTLKFLLGFKMWRGSWKIIWICQNS